MQSQRGRRRLRATTAPSRGCAASSSAKASASGSAKRRLQRSGGTEHWTTSVSHRLAPLRSPSGASATPLSRSSSSRTGSSRQASAAALAALEPERDRAVRLAARRGQARGRRDGWPHEGSRRVGRGCAADRRPRDLAAAGSRRRGRGQGRSPLRRARGRS